MVDGKMVSYLQGDSGSPCHYCGNSIKEINSILNIMKGFDITKSYDSCKKNWDLIENKDINWNDPERQGQCHSPLVEVKYHCILHWKLRSFDFILQLYYRLVANVDVWGESNKTAMVLVEAARKEAINHVRLKTGMLIDTPQSGGGNTNTGVLAVKFLLK